MGRWRRKGWSEMVLGLTRKVDGGGLVTPFESWPTSTTAPNLFNTTNTLAAQNTEGIFYAIGGAFEDISSTLSARYGRWVVWAKNVNGNSTIEGALAAIRVETKPC